LDLKSLYVEEKNTIILEDKEKEPIITKREFNDDLWLEVIASESNQDLQTINSYLINNDITDYNDYTGLFKDKNLIVIMMESVNDIIINEKYYPNFYKMYSEGWAFTNSYSPRNSCATGNNEFSGMTGLYTIYNNCTANVYQKNTYQTSIFNLFKNAGYRAFSMHNYTDAYYDRTVIHPNLGSEKYYSVDDLGIKYFNEYRNWSSDEDFLQVAMDITLNESEEPFMLWLTTVSSHQPYVVSSVEGDKYLELFSDLEYPDDLKRYMSKLKTLDNALGIMLNRLEQKGILEDTVIVLYGDHYPYGLANETINYVLNYNLDDYEVERTPFVIYNPLMEKKEFTQYNTYINITPTVANLFDLDYDPRLYMGSDLFSENYKSRVVFPDGSWKNEIAYYNGATGEIKYNLGYSVDEIKRINNEVMLKIKISNLIIENNYFGLLEQKLALAKESSIASLEGEK